MKICVLTGRFGMGHFVAATALKQQIDESCMEADVEIIDWLSYASPRFADKYYSFYTFLVNRGRGVYNTWYRFFENRKPNQKPELSTYFEGCFSKFMTQKQPDLIISTLPLCSQIVSLYKERTGCGIPLITCVTDITEHSEWISKNTGLYLVGSKFVKEKFIEKGVSPEKIHITGIPVRLDFIKDPPLEYSKSQSPVRKLLIMGGGLGMLPESLEFYKGLDALSSTEITVITGHNLKLQEQLAGKFEHIEVLGFVNNISDYMRRSDLVITKPGGITTFEAIHCEVPIIALNPQLQQEIYNANYIQEMQIGTVVSGNTRLCLTEIIRILNYGKLNDYRYHIRQIKMYLAANCVSEILQDAIYQNQIKKGNIVTDYNTRNEEMKINEKVSFNI